MTKRCAFIQWLLILTLALAAIGCAAPLDFTYAPRQKDAKPSTTVKKLGDKSQAATPYAVLVERFRDSRKTGAGTRAIGRIAVPVFDMNGDRLDISKDVPVVVQEAFISELKAAGHEVHTGAGGREMAAYAIGGEVKSFRLDLDSRDSVEITIASSLTDLKTGKLVWAGEVTEKSDRFAGVSGNSRKTISDYLAASLSKVVRTTMDEALAAAEAPRQSPAPAEDRQVPGKGRLSVKTAPERAKVYVNGVYYGLTPLVIELDDGVYEVGIKAAGYKDSIEKVAVGPGRTTEMETTLEGAEGRP